MKCFNYFLLEIAIVKSIIYITYVDVIKSHGVDFM